jgi:protoheme ferro-lyase
MRIVMWISIVLLSLATGWLAVGYMTVPPIQMSAYLAGACFGLAGLIALLTRFRGRDLGIVIGVSLVLLLGGYWAHATVVLGQEDSRTVPELTRQPGDPGKGFTAVVYFTHGEPETYDPIGWLNQFREFDEQGISFVPFLARPFFIYALRDAYLKVGSSHHRQMHLQMARRLEDKLRAEGMPDVRVYVSFLDDEPRPDAAVIQALNDGASRIIVSEVFLTISNHTKEGEEQIEAVDVKKLGVPLVMTGPMWDSKTMYDMFVDKVNDEVGSADRSKVGVLLVGHGQPDEWDVEFPTETEQEALFRERIMDALVQAGYRRENLGSAWMSFKEPLPMVKAEEIAANGAEKIAFFAAAISAESIHSQYDIPELVAKAKLPEGVTTVNLGAWSDHELTLDAIAEKIRDAAE